MLIKRTEDIFLQLKQQNIDNSNTLITKFVVSNFNEVEKKLREDQFKTYNDFETEVFHYQNYCFENTPPGPNKKEIILEFCANAKSQGAFLFLRAKESQIKLNQALNSERSQKLEKELDEIRKELLISKDLSEDRTRKLEQEKAEIQVKYSILLEKVEDLQNQLR